ncbi:MAG: type II secretion system F family protein [Isosphaeraceae bacterium]
MGNTGASNGGGSGLTGAETAELSRQIAGLTRAGLPLAAGLAALSEELPRGRLRRSMGDLARALEAGAPLDQAIGDQQDAIPPHLRGLVVAGARSGRIGDVLARFSSFAGLGVDLKRRLMLSLAYPLITLAITLGLFLFVSSFAVSQFEKIFMDFGIPLPGLTIVIILSARAINKAAGPLACMFLSLVVAWLAARLLLKPAVRRSLSTQVPLFGPIWAATRLSEFCHFLALLLEGQLPLPEALRLTGQGLEDSSMERACANMAREVESGRSLDQAMSKFWRFPPGLPRLLGWAENQMALSEVLHLAGVLFETQARSKATLAGTTVTIVCVVLVLALIMVIPGLFLPLITLISRLSG